MPHSLIPHERERHRSGRGGWLRAAVHGSDDAIVSTASLTIGVAASAATKTSIAIAGVAGLVAGAMSMAVGEFVSVSSQRDAERAALARPMQAAWVSAVSFATFALVPLAALFVAPASARIGERAHRSLEPAWARAVLSLCEELDTLPDLDPSVVVRIIASRPDVILEASLPDGRTALRRVHLPAHCEVRSKHEQPSFAGATVKPDVTVTVSFIAKDT